MGLKITLLPLQLFEGGGPNFPKEMFGQLQVLTYLLYPLIAHGHAHALTK